MRETLRRYAGELQLREERTADLLVSLRSGSIDLALLAAPVPGDVWNELAELRGSGVGSRAGVSCVGSGDL